VNDDFNSPSGVTTTSSFILGRACSGSVFYLALDAAKASYNGHPSNSQYPGYRRCSATMLVYCRFSTTAGFNLLCLGVSHKR